MIAFLPLPLLLFTPLLMIALRVARRRFRAFWLLAALAGLAAWAALLASVGRIPFNLPLVAWKPEELFPVAPELLWDAVSWPYALAVATLVLASVLTDVARPERAVGGISDWAAWASGMALGGLGLLAILAGNLLTVLLAWSALDLVEIIIWLTQVQSSEAREQAVVAFSGRLAGTVGELWAGMLAQAQGLSLSLEQPPAQISTVLLLAGGLRLGVLPISSPLSQDLIPRRSLGALLRLAPAAAALPLVVRSGVVGASPAWLPVIFGVAGLAALYGGLSWAGAPDENQAQSYWLLGMAALALGAAARGQPAASLAWGLALLLPGGLLLLSTARQRALLPLLLLGWLGMSALPLTPAWRGLGLYAPPFPWLGVFFLAAQASLAAGYLRHALRAATPLSSPVVVERWVWLVYPLGMLVIVATHLALAWWLGRPELSPSTYPGWLDSWPGVASAALALAFAAWRQRGHKVSPRLLGGARRLLSIGWFYRLLWALFYALRRAAFFTSANLEGQAGILWALLLLILLLSLFFQLGLGA